MKFSLVPKTAQSAVLIFLRAVKIVGKNWCFKLGSSDLIDKLL